MLGAERPGGAWDEGVARRLEATETEPEGNDRDLIDQLEAMGERGMADMGEMQMPLPENTLRLLLERRQTGDLPRTGADLVSYWKREKLIGTRPESADSSAHARRLREKAERRRGA